MVLQGSESGAGPNPLAAFGPPYPPSTAFLGEVPSVLPDVPVTAVFLLLFVLAAAAHVLIFKINKKQSHLFFLSMIIFGRNTMAVMQRLVLTRLRFLHVQNSHLLTKNSMVIP